MDYNLNTINKKELDILKFEYMHLKDYYSCTYKFGEDPINSELNRYSNIMASDNHGVKIRNGKYINADYIGTEFIATQYPMENTILDFWEMIIENKVPLIIMLTRETIRYFPLINTMIVFDKFSIHNIRQEENDGIIVREFEITFNSRQQSHTVFHIQYNNWEDHGLPRSIYDIQKLIQLYKTVQPTITVVHCTAGVGRTGTFIGILYAYFNKFNDANTITTILRHSRIKMIQTFEQYKFLHYFIKLLQ